MPGGWADDRLDIDINRYDIKPLKARQTIYLHTCLLGTRYVPTVPSLRVESYTTPAAPELVSRGLRLRSLPAFNLHACLPLFSDHQLE